MIDTAQLTRLPVELAALTGAARAPAMLRARDGSLLRWGEAGMPTLPSVVHPGAPTPFTVAVSPVRPGQAIVVEHRLDGGPVRQAVGVPERRSRDGKALTYRALLPGQPAGLVEFLPVLHFAGQPLSPRLGESVRPLAYRVGSAAAPEGAAAATPRGAAAPEAATAAPRWRWGTKFLGSLSVNLDKQTVGPLPDGLRINWLVKDGHFVGPGIEAKVLPGGCDAMRIRTDGIGLVSVRACIETTTGARIHTSYSGMFDLGPDGYARALRGEFDPMPPLVLTPTYTTADPALKWLNRLQCLGVGTVDTRAQRVEVDEYIVEVAGGGQAG